MAIKHRNHKLSKERGYASEWNDDHIIDGNIDFSKYQANNLAIDNVTTWPTAPVVGQIIYRTDLKTIYCWNGTAWEIYKPALRSTTLIIAGQNSKDKTRADYICDGSSDEIEINQAINDLPLNGGKITLLEGDYNFSASVSITKSNVTIEGQGQSTTINTSVIDLHFFTASNKSRITIRNMRFISTIEGTEMATISTCNYFKFEEIWISGTFLTFTISGGRAHIIKDILTEQWCFDCNIYNVQNMLIKNIVMHSTTEDYPRISSYNSSRIAITNCRINQIFLGSGSDRCSVTNCICSTIDNYGTNNVFAGNITGA